MYPSRLPAPPPHPRRRVLLRRLPDAPVLPLVNPGFENGGITPWTHRFYHPGIPEGSANASIVSVGHPRETLLQVAWSELVYGVFNLSQTVDGLCTGKTYNVSFAFQFHDWHISYHPDECMNTVELSGATSQSDTTFGPANNGTRLKFHGAFKASKTGLTGLTVTTTCRTEPDEDAVPGWNAWYDDFRIAAID